ncbi:hypothetical protein NE237_014328 [Protea cynaroides]|uniref:Uncharacterized protein n=1 Tax=Protea cynaroides TaxID=273540 RepID=A0A9Q0KBW9_9MAGN|nr:hypothetical protein NE237_014328 [Protea cynaroides]
MTSLRKYNLGSIETNYWAVSSFPSKRNPTEKFRKKSVGNQHEWDKFVVLRVFLAIVVAAEAKMPWPEYLAPEAMVKKKKLRILMRKKEPKEKLEIRERGRDRAPVRSRSEQEYSAVGSESIMSRFFTSDSSCLTSESSCKANVSPDLKDAYQGRGNERFGSATSSSACLEKSYGFNEIAVGDFATTSFMKEILSSHNSSGGGPGGSSVQAATSAGSATEDPRR